MSGGWCYYWGFYCEDCRELNGTYLQQEYIDNFLSYWALRKLMDSLGINRKRIGIYVVGGKFAEDLMDEFYTEHKDHNICLMNEGGYKKELKLSDRVKDSLLLLEGKLCNYKMIFTCPANFRIIYVHLQANNLTEAEQVAEQYKKCLEPHYLYSVVEYTSNSLDNPPKLAWKEKFISVEQLKQLPEYKSQKELN